MDLLIKQSIASAVISAVVVAVNVIQTKHKKEIFALQEIIKKSLFLKESPSSIPSFSPITTLKIYSSANFLSKTTTEI